LVTNQWYEIEVIYQKSSGKAVIFINGQYDCQKQLGIDTSKATNGGSVIIGNQVFNKGDIDYVTLYNYLTSSVPVVPNTPTPKPTFTPTPRPTRTPTATPTPDYPYCFADDSTMGSDDLSAWSEAYTRTDNLGRMDVNQDNFINSLDFTYLHFHWGSACKVN
jgi:hypothetical protein